MSACERQASKHLATLIAPTGQIGRQVSQAARQLLLLKTSMASAPTKLAMAAKCISACWPTGRLRHSSCAMDIAMRQVVGWAPLVSQVERSPALGGRDSRPSGSMARDKSSAGARPLSLKYWPARAAQARARPQLLHSQAPIAQVGRHARCMPRAI